LFLEGVDLSELVYAINVEHDGGVLDVRVRLKEKYIRSDGDAMRHLKGLKKARTQK